MKTRAIVGASVTRIGRTIWQERSRTAGELIDRDIQRDLARVERLRGWVRLALISDNLRQRRRFSVDQAAAAWRMNRAQAVARIKRLAAAGLVERASRPRAAVAWWRPA